MYTLTRHFVTEDGTWKIGRDRYQSFMCAQDQFEVAVQMINGEFPEELPAGMTLKSVMLVGQGGELIGKYEEGQEEVTN